MRLALERVTARANRLAMQGETKMRDESPLEPEPSSKLRTLPPGPRPSLSAKKNFQPMRVTKLRVELTHSPDRADKSTKQAGTKKSLVLEISAVKSA